MKVALLVSGQWRTGSTCWPRIAAGFARYEPDIYYLAHPGDTEPQFGGDYTRLEVEDTPQNEKDYASNLGPGTKNLQGQLRALNDLRTLSRKVRETGRQYDWMVRCRPDLWMVTLPEALEFLNPKHAYVPTHDNWFGLCDKFMIAKPEHMRVAMERYDRLPEFWAEKHLFHMEPFLAWAMKGIPIARTRTTFGMLRDGGQYTQPYRGAHWLDVPAIDPYLAGVP